MTITADDLSPVAQAVLSAYWGPMNTKEVIFHCRISRPSPEMQSGLDELADKGLLIRDITEYRPPTQHFRPVDGVTYELGRDVFRQHNKDGFPSAESTLPSFPITVPIGSPPRR